MKKFLTTLILVVFIAGCNSYRFVPSHGGGKRFDEEERAVAAAVRNAVAQIDVQNLSGHKANVVVTTLSHNGGATLNFPGFTNASASYSYNSQNYSTVPVVLSDQDSWTAALSYNPNINAVPTVFGTDQDVTYLEAALQLRLRVNNVSVAVPDPEYILYVLVDVLGTNRSKQDSIFVWQDTLTASCELTYYLVDTKTNKVVSGAKRASAEASYQESSVFGFAGYEGDRRQRITQPNPMPTDANDPVIVFNQTTVFRTDKKCNPVLLLTDRPDSNSSQSCAAHAVIQNDGNSAAKPAAAPAPIPEPNNAPTPVPVSPAPIPAPTPEPNTAPPPVPVPATAPEPNTAPNPAPAPEPNQPATSVP